MTTISAFTKTGNDNYHKKIVSDPATLATPDDIELEGLPDAFTHVNIGIQMFDGGGALTLGSAGTFAIKTKSINTMQWEVHTGSPLNATAPVTLSLEGNISAVQIVETSLAGCITWKAVLTFNKR
jgi:hypothetical protein